MRNLKLHNLMTLVFFCSCGLFIAYCIHYLVTLEPDLTRVAAAAPSVAAQQAGAPDQYVLVKGHPSAMGNLNIRYIGLEDDIILIDVTIMDLDPNYAYRHRISRDAAQNGFRIAGKAFKLLSVRDSVLKLKTQRG